MTDTTDPQLISLTKLFLLKACCFFHWKHNLTLLHVTHKNNIPASSQTPNMWLKTLTRPREDCHHSVRWECDGRRPQWSTAAVFLYWGTKLSGHISHAHQPRKDTSISHPLIPALFFFLMLLFDISHCAEGHSRKSLKVYSHALWGHNAYCEENQIHFSTSPLITVLPLSHEHVNQSDFHFSN